MNKEIKELVGNFNLLYVEDEESLRETSSSMFKYLFKKVDTAQNGKEGLELYKENSYDIVITDINMPILDGLEMSKQIREINPEQTIIITSAYSDSEKLMETIKIGLDSYLVKPIDWEQLLKVLKKVSLNIKNKIENEYYKLHLEEMIETKVNEVLQLENEKLQNYEDTILALVNMVEIRDSYTSGHSQRVAYYSSLIAKQLALSEEEVHKVYQAGILHDIGKIAIPDSILLKPTTLSKTEYNLMKKHAVMSCEIIEKIPMYKDLSVYVKYHHERYDGSGYPEGLKGDEIPLLSQIMAVADTFDAMTTSRIYRPRKDRSEAVIELHSLSNKSFSSEVVEAAILALKDVDIDTSINQNPLTEFEEQRFSFFYKDKLTNLYNSDYLDLILNTNGTKENYNYMTVAYLHNFGLINKVKSWEMGDRILIEFSKYLKENFDQDCLLFRFRGDDFIILNSKEFKDVDIMRLEDYNITISLDHINLIEDNIKSYKDLKEYLHL